MASKVPLPPSGTRDFLPDTLALRNHVIDIIRRNYENHGFSPLETPAFEKLSVLTGKYGDEGDKLLFKILHRGEKLQRILGKDEVSESDLAETALRYDLTVPLARVYSSNREQLSRIFKRYQIQPVWRADRPAKGRFREFYQCDVDVIGGTELTSEVDIFHAVNVIMNELGLHDFQIVLNHRKILFGMLDGLKIEASKHIECLTILDKLDKTSPQDVISSLKQLNIPGDSLKIISDIIELVNGEELSNIELLDKISGVVTDEGKTGVGEILQILKWADEAEIGNHLKFGPVLARGLDYYTGPIFELRIPGHVSSFGGGGRYDGLISIFCGENIPAVGFSFGLERIIELLKESSPELPSSVPDFSLAVLDRKNFSFGYSALNKIRKAGISADIYPEFPKPTKFFKWVDRKQIPYAAVIGDNEISSGNFTVKRMADGYQKTGTVEELIDFIKESPK
ncbi:MAG: histidine--tRNA ligase [Deltaproteobacteria bacterium]|nr:histidine--tRNA ligase [Deltaproteobacteria bacterium]